MFHCKVTGPYKGLLTPLFLLSVAMPLSGCGKGFISDASLRGYLEEGQTYVEAKLRMETGNVVLPGLEVPIRDPKNPAALLGSVAFRPAIGSSSTELALNVNLSAAAKVQGMDGRYLPNGTKIPVGGIDSLEIVALPVGGNGIIVYVAVDTASKTALLGAAFPIREFAGISESIGGMNVFPVFKFGKIQGVAGIYTSPPELGKNGLAVFLDAGSILNDSALANGMSVAQTERPELKNASTAAPALRFHSSEAGSRMKIRTYNALQRLGSKQRGKAVTVGE